MSRKRCGRVRRSTCSWCRNANAGSSSIKFSLFVTRGGELALDVQGQVEAIDTAPQFIAKRPDGATAAEKTWAEGTRPGHDGALDHLFAFLPAALADNRLAGVGHRVVHGGTDYTQPVAVDAGVAAALERLVPLAPLHQPHNLAPIRRLLERAPELPQVACFDTAFHCTNPDLAQRFGLPGRLHEAGVRRYGFHGLSYEYIASTLAQFAPEIASGRTVVLHLGNGSSMCAMEAGRSIASTMGFTPVEGLLMGTRSGSVDPGVILYLMDHEGMDARAVETLLYHESGLLGVSGISSDMRTSSRRAIHGRSSRSICTAIASDASLAPWPPRSGGWTRSSSPAGLAKTPWSSANACAAMQPGRRPTAPR